MLELLDCRRKDSVDVSFADDLLLDPNPHSCFAIAGFRDTNQGVTAMSSSNPDQCRRAGVVDDVTFQTKPQTALGQTDLRDGITKLGLCPVAGIPSLTSVWAPGGAPKPAGCRAATDARQS
jgi:hypothetical protein